MIKDVVMLRTYAASLHTKMTARGVELGTMLVAGRGDVKSALDLASYVGQMEAIISAIYNLERDVKDG